MYLCFFDRIPLHRRKFLGNERLNRTNGRSKWSAEVFAGEGRQGSLQAARTTLSNEIHTCGYIHGPFGSTIRRVEARIREPEQPLIAVDTEHRGRVDGGCDGESGGGELEEEGVHLSRDEDGRNVFSQWKIVNHFTIPSGAVRASEVNKLTHESRGSGEWRHIGVKLMEEFDLETNELGNVEGRRLGYGLKKGLKIDCNGGSELESDDITYQSDHFEARDDGEGGIASALSQDFIEIRVEDLYTGIPRIQSLGMHRRQL